MHGGQNQMTGLGGAECESHGLGFPHFTHHQHIWIFPQGIQQRLFKAWCVPPNLALTDIGVPGPECVLDRILNRDDVPRSARFISWIKAANVDDLPEPVGPLTNIRPCGCDTNFLRSGWRFSFSIVAWNADKSLMASPTPRAV